MVYLALGRARLSGLVVLTTFAGFWLAEGNFNRPALFLATLLGTTLTAVGASALNQWMERDRDACMRRTAGRPLPSGRITPRHAFLWGLVHVAAGLAVLAFFVNAITAWLALLVESVYLLLYTPLKTRTSFCTLVGAVCGAIPPMMGWTAARGELAPEAWILGAILYVWQIPHFLALAWIFRDEYERGGFRMLPIVDRTGGATSALVLAGTLLLLPLALAAVFLHMAGPASVLFSLVLGAVFTLLALELRFQRTAPNARRVFLASLLYLPATLGLMMIDRGNDAPLPLPFRGAVDHYRDEARSASDPLAAAVTYEPEAPGGARHGEIPHP